MQIETFKVEPVKTPPKKARKKTTKQKKRKKETPKEWAPLRKNRKKNTPRKDLDDGPKLNVNLNLNQNLTQSTKISLITDFFSTIKKVVKAPDPV